MQLGWREYFKQRFKKQSAFHSLGIEFGEQSLHLSLFNQSNGQLCWVHQHTLPQSNWQQQLASYVRQQGLSNTPTHIAFSVGNYQLLQMTKPNVDQTEIAAALRWPIKELVPGDSELVIDYFDFPVQIGAEQKINVVAIERTKIEEVVRGILSADLNLQSIGIEELATCNLIVAQDEAVLTLLQQPGEDICLNIVKNQQLYFSRRLKGYENLASFSQKELQMGLVDSLNVEIQRSMDYFESQLRQAPVQKVLLDLDSPHQDILCDLIQQMTQKNASPFVPEIEKKASLEYHQASFVSLGAALACQQAVSTA